MICNLRKVTTIEEKKLSKAILIVRAPLVGVGVLIIAISGLIIAHPIGFDALPLAVVMSIALLIIGIEITAMGVVGKLIVGKIPNRKKS